MLAAPPTSARSRGRSLPLKGGGATPNLPSKGEGEDGGDDARICLGVVTGAHGVRGRVRVKSFTAEPHAIARYGALESDAAERLKGTRLYVRRAALPPPEEEEFYQADLVGLEARRSDGTVMRKVSAVHDFG